MKTIHTVTASLVAAITVVACAQESPPNPQVPREPPYGYAASTPPPYDQSAVARIAEAMCDYDVSCNRLGAGHEYATRDACVDGRRAKLAVHLRPSECIGIDHDRLQTCIAAIQSERCGKFLDTQERVGACERSEICAR